LGRIKRNKKFKVPVPPLKGPFNGHPPRINKKKNLVPQRRKKWGFLKGNWKPLGK